MNGSDRGKLIKAGFRIMRVSLDRYSITELSKTGSWVLVDRYTTQSKTTEAIRVFREESNVIFESE
ncbi:hypothetical protein [Methylobacter sp. S3L5C]|uniref:hypothetical protein n=1 Tax=Methylobacter sp. S3L5C TaxID=2839024 RepID=UPI001FAC4735|nr:hypothetical protein [Methylobacter sp. S3L5C]UOA08359.1 hypothetical protein KKZ03_19485 [Methylobacter sp. S3L5C]